LILGGGLIGMAWYYKPVSGKAFVEYAFEQTQSDVQEQLANLKKARRELLVRCLTSDSAAFLDSRAIAHDQAAIRTHCANIVTRITDPAQVQALKTNFRTRFATIRRSPHLRDNIEAAAFKAIKQNNMKWGVGIGAVIGLTLGLLNR
jgi:N12 class adenine-specific DNA methylase